MLNIRLAVPADAEALVRLNDAFNEVSRPVEAVRSSLTTGAEAVVVAEAGGEAVAFCCAQVHHSFCYPSPVAEVTEMYVDNAFRRQGCARAMLAFLEEHLCTVHGVDELHLLTGVSNTAAQAAYQHAGFSVKNEVYMSKDICRKR